MLIASSHRCDVMEGDVVLIDKEGMRSDGRAPEELRPIKIKAGVLNRADGSASVEWGGNKVLAAVYGPRETHPRHRMDPSKALVRCNYHMATFSVLDRKRPGPDRRSTEISKVISEAFSHVIFTERFPRTTIDVFIEVLQADAGTRCAGITAASVALADAGIPMRDLVPACAAGKVSGVVVLDLNKDEDNQGDADLPVAYLPRTKEFLLLQMDGHFTKEEFVRATEMVTKACEKISELQKVALKEKYISEIPSQEPGIDRVATDIEPEETEGASDQVDEEQLKEGGQPE